jgi:segregation and condensation protein B
MTTPPPLPAEDPSTGPVGTGPAAPVVGPPGDKSPSGSGVVATTDPQPKSEIEEESRADAGQDHEGTGVLAAGSDVAPDAELNGTRADAEALEPEPELSGGPTRPGTSPQSVAEGFEGDPTAWPPDEAFEAVELDDQGWTRRDLEAILLVADEPVPAAVLAEVVGARLSEVEELLVDLAGDYARDGRGFVLRAIAGGWRLYTNPGARAAVEAYLRAGQQSRLTRAALETLAVIAYRQPVTRFQVAAVRGVNVDGVFRTLASRGLIHEVGTDPGPGQAILYGTTPAFLEQLGLNSLDQLPPIKDYLPEGVDLIDLQEQP